MTCEELIETHFSRLDDHGIEFLRVATETLALMTHNERLATLRYLWERWILDPPNAKEECNP